MNDGHYSYSRHKQTSRTWLDGSRQSGAAGLRGRLWVRDAPPACLLAWRKKDGNCSSMVWTTYTCTDVTETNNDTDDDDDNWWFCFTVQEELKTNNQPLQYITAWDDASKLYISSAWPHVAWVLLVDQWIDSWWHSGIVCYMRQRKRNTVMICATERILWAENRKSLGTHFRNSSIIKLFRLRPNSLDGTAVCLMRLFDL